MNLSKVASFCLISLFFFSYSCTKEKQSVVPYSYVNITIDLNDIEFIDLQAIGGKVAVYGGVKGIVIYRSNIDEFKAFDRTCTFDPISDCRVGFDDSNIVLVKCSCCESQYELNFGTVSVGPASLPIKEYNTTYGGGNTLRIHN